jgi:hypothetical protein
MAKRVNRGRSSELSARSRPSRERQVRDCAVAAVAHAARGHGEGHTHGSQVHRHETMEMKTLGRGSHRDAPAAVQTVAHGPVPARTVTAIRVARRAVLAAPAGGADASASPSPRPAEGNHRRAGGGPADAVPLTWNLTQATDWPITQATDWDLTQATGRNLRQAKELTPS